MTFKDFQVKTPQACVTYGTKNPNLAWLMDLLLRYGICWTSTRPAYITTIGVPNTLPQELEFYDGFDKSPQKLPQVMIEGVPFKTY